jgi:type IV secretory pathway VirB3-like protein
MIGNLGAIETRKRLVFGVTLLVIALALTLIFFWLNVRGPWLLVLFVPFWLAALGLLEYRGRN